MITTNEHGERIVTEARKWIGTPFGHQQSTLGLAVDCANFVEQVVCQSGAVPPLPLAHDYQSSGAIAAQTMIRMLTLHLVYVTDRGSDLRVGDVVALHDGRVRSAPRHLVFISQVRADGVRYCIHAGERGVVEHRFSLEFELRIHSVWRVKAE